MKKQTHKKTIFEPLNESLAFRRWIFAAILIHVVLCLIYWSYTPFGLPPDEGPHGKYVNHLVENQLFPVFDANDKDNYEFHQPPLYYMLSVPFYLIGNLLDLQDPAYAIRILSIILGALSIILVYLTVDRIFADKRLSAACMLFVTLLPTHIMLSSSVSNDILAELLFSFSLFLMIKQLKNRLSWRMTVYTGLIMGLGLLTKTTCILIIPIYIFMILLMIKSGKICKTDIKQILVTLVITAVVGGGWLIRNNILYGDLFGLQMFKNAFQDTAKPEYFLSRGFSQFQYVLLVITWTFASFWGVFGHMKIFMPTWIYISLAVISVIFLILSIGTFMRDIKRDPIIKYSIALCFGLLILVILSFISFNINYFQAQGRYLYPAIIPIAFLVCKGAIKAFPNTVIYLIMIVLQVFAIFAIS